MTADFPDHIGDHLIYSKGFAIVFSRNNAWVVLSTRRHDEEMFRLAKHIDSVLLSSLVPDTGKPFVPELTIDETLIPEELRKDAHADRPVTPRKKRPEELREAVLKALPKDRAQQLCLENVRKLSLAPDTQAGDLAFYLQGLPVSADAESMALLQRLQRTAQNPEVLRMTASLQYKWLRAVRESTGNLRVTALRQLASKDASMRREAIRMLGRLGDWSVLPEILHAAMSDASLQDAVEQALGDLFGRKGAGAWPESEKEDLNRLAEQIRKLRTMFPER